MKLGIARLSLVLAALIALPALAQNVTGSGKTVLQTSPTLVTPILGTPQSGTLTNATGLPLGGLASQSANTVVGRTSSSGVPSALAVGSCSGASSALNWTTDTGFGCNTSITANTAGTNSTFTPAISIGGSTTGITYAASTTGEYSQIGNLVIAVARVTLTSKGAQVGSVLITGLPVAAKNANPGSACSILGDALAAGAITALMAQTVANSTTVQLFTYAAGAVTALANTGISDTTTLIVSCSYFSA